MSHDGNESKNGRSHWLVRRLDYVDVLLAVAAFVWCAGLFGWAFGQPYRGGDYSPWVTRLGLLVGAGIMSSPAVAILLWRRRVRGR